ncbi:VanZ family protein [Bacillus massiliigorillae]|uniref:VanZ family protein n=1 Tax=Bacillus massiliigorillae TaxID=1243664 RepID=UPI00039D3DB8|nr:VanZ family protein [Bacillus massiliigorillae]
MENQLGFFEAIIDLLYLKPLFIFGLALVGLLLYWLCRKDKKLLTFRTIIGSILLYYYLCIVLNNIVGIPTLSEFFRLAHLGESLFNPNISLIPLINGISLEFILNIFCFIPLGFLCPLISRAYEQTKRVVLLGFVLSLVIEISQLFTLYRATDSNDLIANVLGTIIGYLCFKLLVKLGLLKSYFKPNFSLENDPTRLLPILIVVCAFAITFIS